MSPAAPIRGADGAQVWWQIDLSGTDWAEAGPKQVQPNHRLQGSNPGRAWALSSIRRSHSLLQAKAQQAVAKAALL